MPDATDRPQDAGRPHRRRLGAPSPETEAILERYYGAMRAELADTLDELRPERAQLTLDGAAERMRPALADRVKLWDLAVKLGRELASPGASELDPGSATAAPTSPASRSSARAPRLSARERKSLGG